MQKLAFVCKAQACDIYQSLLSFFLFLSSLWQFMYLLQLFSERGIKETNSVLRKTNSVLFASLCLLHSVFKRFLNLVCTNNGSQIIFCDHLWSREQDLRFFEYIFFLRCVSSVGVLVHADKMWKKKRNKYRHFQFCLYFFPSFLD